MSLTRELLAAAALLSQGLAHGAATQPAQLVITDAKIYTADASHRMAQALAIGGGRILFVGSNAQAAAFIGPHTEVRHLAGALVLPGLIDSHVHPLDIVDLDVCDLSDKPRTLRDIGEFVRGCVEHYRPGPTEWLIVHQWNYADGNQPDAAYPTLRAALDHASTRAFIQLLGDDGHHAAFNSAALASAKNAAGQTVGFSKATLAKDFAAYVRLIGVDARGEPNGAVNEDARGALNKATVMYNDLPAVLKVPERITQRLNSVGITAVLDAYAAPEGLPVYDKLLAMKKLTVRANLAQFYDPELFRRADGSVDYDAMIAKASAVRAKYADNPLLSADTVKLFADGGLEGNPYAVPPTLPDAASLKPFLQPIFGRDAAGRLTVKGYVDSASPLCSAVRARPQQYEAYGFTREHGFHPAQCTVSSGQLQHDRGVIREFVRRFHLAGFQLHIHAIGDTAVHTAVEALEAARAADGVHTTRDGIAHVQLADSADIERIGRDHFYIAFTYAWMYVDLDYDLTVIPFIERVQGNSYAALHVPGSYYEAHVYPVKSIQRAGGILVAGSDAPVETRDPRPFLNIALAVTRRLPGRQALNGAERISLQDVLDAYTINGARFLGREREAGSLEAGKSADFIIVDQDILKFAAPDKADRIAATKVRETWFMGRQVYVSAAAQ